MRQSDSPPLVVLLGPTASGKTPLSVQWAKCINAEIVSADSVQVYRYMDIGTAKPSIETRQAIPHHLIDVVDPDEPFDAVRYQQLADKAISEIQKRGKVPMVVGGTGLYVKALTHGFFAGPSAHPRLREMLKARAEMEGTRALHEELRRVDPSAAERIHPNDLFRIIRALEVYHLTGVPISRHQDEHRFSRPRYKALYLCLDLPREELYRRINERVEEMIKRGLVEEVKALMERGYSLDLPSMRSIGYRHMGSYIKGECSLDEAVEKMKRDTRHYARRQLTWFRAMEGVRWFHEEESDRALQEAKSFLEGGRGTWYRHIYH
jgi:tRNA dimethylallyltransferase